MRERGNDSVRNEDTVKERKKEKLGSQYEDLRLFFCVCGGVHGIVRSGFDD